MDEMFIDLFMMLFSGYLTLIVPFWMLPLLGILNLKARDIVGYATLQFVVHAPLVLFLVWALNYTLAYVPPAP